MGGSEESDSHQPEEKYLEVRVEGLDGREGAEDVRTHNALQLRQIPGNAVGVTLHIAPSAPADSAMIRLFLC